MQNQSLVQIKTNDGLTLPGLLYEIKGSTKAAIFLHGNGSSSVFYSDELKDDQVKALNKIGISYLFFNNRGAHLIKKLDVEEKGRVKRKYFGMAYEKIKECTKDIDGAIDFLRKRGYKEFYLIGVSTGANKICVYNYYRPKNPVSKFVLIGGGDDTGIYYHQLGKEKFYKLLNKSKEKIKKQQGEEIICESFSGEIFSYVGFYDIANPDGDYNTFPFLEVLKDVKLSTKPLFRYFKSIKKPTLIIYGEKDEWTWGNTLKIVEILKKQKPGFKFKIIKGADHPLTKHQKELSQILSTFLQA